MRALALLALAALAAALLSGGLAPFGRILLALDMPRLAAMAFDEPGWKGVALYRSGDFEGSAEAFEDADMHFDQGTALARAGDYAAALEALDVAIARGDPTAQANFDVVSAFYASLRIDAETLALFARPKEGVTTEASVGEGSGRASGTGSDVTNANTMLGLAALESRGEAGVRRVFDDKFMVANDRWLSQLADVPGAYLSARILQEHKRRLAAGVSSGEANR